MPSNLRAHVHRRRPHQITVLHPLRDGIDVGGFARRQPEGQVSIPQRALFLRRRRFVVAHLLVDERSRRRRQPDFLAVKLLKEPPVVRPADAAMRLVGNNQIKVVGGYRLPVPHQRVNRLYRGDRNVRPFPIVGRLPLVACHHVLPIQRQVNPGHGLPPQLNAVNEEENSPGIPGIQVQKAQGGGHGSFPCSRRHFQQKRAVARLRLPLYRVDGVNLVVAHLDFRLRRFSEIVGPHVGSP